MAFSSQSLLASHTSGALLFNASEFTWSMDWNTFGDGFHYFFYVLRKGRRSSESNGLTEKVEMSPVSLFHDELETEDYIFLTNLGEGED